MANVMLNQASYSASLYIARMGKEFVDCVDIGIARLRDPRSGQRGRIHLQAHAATIGRGGPALGLCGQALRSSGRCGTHASFT